jgi:hypothetical protein
LFLRNAGERLSNYTVQRPETRTFILHFLIQRFEISSDNTALLNKRKINRSKRLKINLLPSETLQYMQFYETKY